jgi:hypothetical protein
MDNLSIWNILGIVVLSGLVIFAWVMIWRITRRFPARMSRRQFRAVKAELARHALILADNGVVWYYNQVIAADWVRQDGKFQLVIPNNAPDSFPDVAQELVDKALKQ